MSAKRTGDNHTALRLIAALAASAACLAQQPPRQSPARPAADTQPGGLADRETLMISHSSAGSIAVSIGNRPALLYQWCNTPRKPYVRELHTPGGAQFLLDAPPDHVHHHGLMFAVGVNGVDFWSEGDNTGAEVDRTKAGAMVQTTRRGSALIEQRLHWVPRGDKDETLLVEQRTIELAPPGQGGPASLTLVTWYSRLSVPDGATEAQLTGSHYFGLGMRFVRAMDKVGKFVNSENAAGEIVRGDERLYPGRWCAYRADLDGKPVTVAMFDGPRNIRPATWFTMAEPFAYLSATLKLHKEPLTLKADRPVELCYGIAAWDGRVDAERIEKTYQLWLTRFAKAAEAGPQLGEPRK